jgi:hypothetical protein
MPDDSHGATNRGDVFVTIKPAALPVGAELSIGNCPTYTTHSLIERSAARNCTA